VFVIDGIERLIGWINDHEEESHHYFDYGPDLNQLASRDFNEHKSFLLEIILNVKDINTNYVTNHSKDKDLDYLTPEREGNRK